MKLFSLFIKQYELVRWLRKLQNEQKKEMGLSRQMTRIVAEGISHD